MVKVFLIKKCQSDRLTDVVDSVSLSASYFLIIRCNHRIDMSMKYIRAVCWSYILASLLWKCKFSSTSFSFLLCTTFTLAPLSWSSVRVKAQWELDLPKLLFHVLCTCIQVYHSQFGAMDIHKNINVCFSVRIWIFS